MTFIKHEIILFCFVFFSGSSTVAIDNKIEQAMVSIVVHRTRERGPSWQ
jgi:hypothetical protein